MSGSPGGASEAISFTLDGREIRLATDPDRTVLSVLRHEGGALGARIGCTEGYCGACTVLVDGRAVQTCTAPLWSIAGKIVTTLEGVAPGSTLARVREAFLAEQAAQCGYCVNGLVATIAALLDDPAQPGREAILHALDERHICRCGAHPRILRALDRALAGRRAAA